MQQDEHAELKRQALAARNETQDSQEAQEAVVRDVFAFEVRRVYDEARAMLLAKHEDYGPFNISRSPGGALNGLRVRLHDKLARINHLIDTGKEPTNESLVDSFKDLANYAHIAVLCIEGAWPQ